MVAAANTAAARALVEGLARAGVRDACVTPGSRSTPLTVALAEQDAIRPWLHLDERSSAFFALGLARASGRPVALVCTSGTAAANYHPAVVEADLSRVPLIACTADRPPSLRNVGAPQTIDQVGLYGVSVRHERDLPAPSSPDASPQVFGQAAGQAVEASLGPLPGPVHLNLPFDEPLIEPPADHPAPASAPQPGPLPLPRPLPPAGRARVGGRGPRHERTAPARRRTGEQWPPRGAAGGPRPHPRRPSPRRSTERPSHRRPRPLPSPRRLRRLPPRPPRRLPCARLRPPIRRRADLEGAEPAPRPRQRRDPHPLRPAPVPSATRTPSRPSA